MDQKTFWRCEVCGDLHYGVRPPEKCPTCGVSGEKAVKIEKADFLKILGE